MKRKTQYNVITLRNKQEKKKYESNEMIINKNLCGRSIVGKGRSKASHHILTERKLPFESISKKKKKTIRLFSRPLPLLLLLLLWINSEMK